MIEEKEVMNHYIDEDSKIYGFYASQREIIPEHSVIIPATYTFEKYPYLSLVRGVLTFNEAGYNKDATLAKTENFAAAIQKWLDEYAISWGYTNIAYATTYSNSTVSKFKAEALILISWRDQVWEAVDSLYEAIKAGTVPAPNSIEELISSLPSTPVRP